MDIIYTDLDQDFRFPEFGAKRIPCVGEILYFNHFKGNKNTQYWAKVMNVITKKEMFQYDKIEDGGSNIPTTYTVIMREIEDMTAAMPIDNRFINKVRNL